MLVHVVHFAPLSQDSASSHRDKFQEIRTPEMASRYVVQFS